MKFCILANMEIKENLNYINMIKNYLESINQNCEIANSKQDMFGNYVYDNIPLDTNYLIVLGGDGTILQSVQNSIKINAPIIGFHTGTLGFLCEYQINSFKEIIDKVIKNEFIIEERMLIEVFKDELLLDTCLNDIVISREGFSRIVSMEVSTNNEIVNKFRGDGIVVSTPTGSTGYNLSLGGPIVSPKSNNIIVTPIACHSLISRPIILSDNEIVNIEILKSRKTQEKEAILTCDGRKNIDLHSGDILTIKSSLNRVNFVKLEENKFFTICNQKLKEF